MQNASREVNGRNEITGVLKITVDEELDIVR